MFLFWTLPYKLPLLPRFHSQHFLFLTLPPAPYPSPAPSRPLLLLHSLCPPAKRTKGVITLWSLETVTLLTTLLPPRTREVESRPSATPTKCLGFIAGTGRVMAAGKGYAAVWDMLSPEVREVTTNHLFVCFFPRYCQKVIFRSSSSAGFPVLCVDSSDRRRMSPAVVSQQYR